MAASCLPSVSSDEEDMDDYACLGCGETEKEERVMLECGKCLGGWHLDCLDPPLTEVPEVRGHRGLGAWGHRESGKVAGQEGWGRGKCSQGGLGWVRGMGERAGVRCCVGAGGAAGLASHASNACCRQVTISPTSQQRLLQATAH